MRFVRFIAAAVTVVVHATSVAATGAAVHAPPELEQRARSVLEHALDVLEAAQDPDGSFTAFPPYLGTAFVSQYALFQAWFGSQGALAPAFATTGLKNAELRQRLLAEQLPDGGWQFVPDSHMPRSELSSTILNYWVLKAVLHEDMDSHPMRAARNATLALGGLHSADAMMKWMLALFGVLSWDALPWIPKMPLWAADWVRSHVAQWVWPHLVPMVMLRGVRAVHLPDRSFLLPELCPAGRCAGSEVKGTHARAAAEPSLTAAHTPGWTAPWTLQYSYSEQQRLVDMMVQMQRPRGSFGGYTVASLWASAAFAAFLRLHPQDGRRAGLAVAANRVREFCEDMYFATGPAVYRGVLDDGRNWDTILAGLALAEGGRGSAAARATGFLSRVQEHQGGLSYGQDFEYAPDIDDTGVALVLWGRVRDSAGAQSPAHAPAHNSTEGSGARAASWILGMQNSNGGFAAFDRDKEGQWMVSLVAGAFADSAALWDPACADVTGHVLEGLAAWGIRADLETEADGPVYRSLAFLLGTQRGDGSWWGRWGINTIYATSAALAGMQAVHARTPEALAAMRKGATYLADHQNADGGFGETSVSYANPALAGVGFSTPTQTAWGLIGALAALQSQALDSSAARARLWDVARRAAAYLVMQYEPSLSTTPAAAVHAGFGWQDAFAVGTGHAEQWSQFRGLMLQYPVYARSFPVVALARFLDVHASGHSSLVTPAEPLSAVPVHQHAAGTNPARENREVALEWLELLRQPSLLSLPVLLHSLLRHVVVWWALAIAIVAHLAWMCRRVALGHNSAHCAK